MSLREDLMRRTFAAVPEHIDKILCWGPDASDLSNSPILSLPSPLLCPSFSPVQPPTPPPPPPPNAHTHTHQKGASTLPKLHMRGAGCNLNFSHALSSFLPFAEFPDTASQVPGRPHMMPQSANHTPSLC